MKYVFIIVLVLMTISASAQKTAEEILSAAQTKAKTENKNVFVKFSASWCGWCKQMEASLQKANIKPLFDRNYEFVTLITDERDADTALNTPGADEVRIKYGGNKEEGIPFWFIISPEGKLLADSYEKRNEQGSPTAGSNVGCPAKEPEVKHFVDVLTKTGKFSEQELKLVFEEFRKNEN